MRTGAMRTAAQAAAQQRHPQQQLEPAEPAVELVLVQAGRNASAVQRLQLLSGGRRQYLTGGSTLCSCSRRPTSMRRRFSSMHCRCASAVH